MKTSAVYALAAGLGYALACHAGPTGGKVLRGTAKIETSAKETLITQTSDRAIIDWQRFDLEKGELVRFDQQTGAGAWTVNRVIGGDASRILGTLKANGRIMLLNPNGVLFGSDAIVDTAGLVVSTARLKSDDDFMAGKARLDFEPAAAGGTIVNRGKITIHERGLAAFVAPSVANHGEIRAVLGRIAIGAGSSFTVDFAGDGLVSIALRDEDLKTLKDARSLIENAGTLQAGRIAVMTPAFAEGVVNNAISLGGTVRADRAERDAQGAIVLTAANGKVNLDGNISAPGDLLRLKRTDAGIEVDKSLAPQVSRILQTGTSVALQTSSDITLTERVDGRGGQAGAGLQLDGGRVLLKADVYTANGEVRLSSSKTDVRQMQAENDIEPGRKRPLIYTDGADITISAERHLVASHLITRGAVLLESRNGNVTVESNLGRDLNGTSPLRSLRIRALAADDSPLAGNVQKLYDVMVAPGGTIDIQATRNISILALPTNVELRAKGDPETTGAWAAREGLSAAKRGIEGRSLKIWSKRINRPNLADDEYYWGYARTESPLGADPNSRHLYNPENAADWKNWPSLAKDPNSPTAGGAPGPINVLNGLPESRSQDRLRDVMPQSIPPGVLASTEPLADDATEPDPREPREPREPRSGGRGVARIADVGRTPAVERHRDVFALPKHVVERAACTPLLAHTYFGTTAFGATFGRAGCEP